MRHLIGVVLAIVMAGVLFFAGAWGYLRLTALTAPLSRLPAGGGSLLSDHGMLAALVAVAGTGLLAGILVAAPRISPLAAGLPGLAVARLDGVLRGQRPARGTSDPAEVSPVRGRFRGHALSRDPRGSRPGDDHPALRAVQVAGSQHRRAGITGDSGRTPAWTRSSDRRQRRNRSVTQDRPIRRRHLAITNMARHSPADSRAGCRHDRLLRAGSRRWPTAFQDERADLRTRPPRRGGPELTCGGQ